MIQRHFLTNGPAGRILRNVLFWLLFTAWHYAGRSRFIPQYPALLAVMLLTYGIPAYLHNLWLVPRYLLRRRFAAYTLLFLLLLGLTTVGSYYGTHLVNRLVPDLNYMGSSKDVALPVHVFPSLLMFALLAFGKFMADAIRNQQKMEELERQRLESELQSLRSQVNPHFLFNALNTIYGMARRTDPETAAAVIQLSDILRHSLYDCEEQEIGMEEEIRFLQQYVTFARLRLHEQDRIRLEVAAAPSGHKIVPLLLVPFVENAIKHGLGRQVAPSPGVAIRLEVHDNRLCFSCHNGKAPEAPAPTGMPTHSGIGLKNVRRRLELLYPGRHRLEIQDGKELFAVQLEIELS